MASEKPSSISPRIIIHGGAGNINRQNLPADLYNLHRDAMLGILHKAKVLLEQPHATALDVATYAVSLLENNGMFNAGHGAVYTTAGTQELEASVMVSHGYRKRGVGVMNVRRVKNPIKLAREMLLRGEEIGGGGAGDHCQLQGKTCDDLALDWGLDMVKPSYFWTRLRWDEHRIGLGLKHDDETYEKHKKRADEGQVEYRFAIDTTNDGNELIDLGDGGDSTLDGYATWDGYTYLPQGTVGAVVLDSSGTICAATSTGGLTNKLPGRIGDTPTLGAGFWAESWPTRRRPEIESRWPSLATIMKDCLPGLSGYMSLPNGSAKEPSSSPAPSFRAVGMSGTGNGDSFLRVNAARTAAAIARFTLSHPYGSGVPLQDAISSVAGPYGMLQQSAEDRWHKTGEGEGGIIAIDFDEGRGKVVYDFNCGGMFHAWVDDAGKARFAVFQDRMDE